MENKLYSQDQFESAVQQTQRTFKHYFENQEEERLRDFSNWIDWMLDGQLLLNQGDFKTLPQGVKRFFIQQLDQA